MHAVHGGCYCGNIVLELQLTREPAQYAPRACDCGFCRKHGAAYISDSKGSLRIRIQDPDLSGVYRQGNELAEMLLCTRCGVLVGALYRGEGHVYGTVNAKAIETATQFGSQTTVSPKELTGGEKVERWKKIWFADVRLG